MNNDIFDEARQLRRKAAQASLLSFAKIYLPHHLKLVPSKRHLELLDLGLRLVTQRGKKVAVAAPREFGKTTLFTNILLPYCVCYGLEKFIVILSHTSSQAAQILDSLKQDLTENEKLRIDFPEIFESEGRPKPPRWTQNDIVTRNGIQILALGYGQQIRGRKHGANRPTLVILDDLESGENTFSYGTKEKMKSWLNKSVLRVGSENTNYIFLGNVFNSFSLLGEIVKTKEKSLWDKEHYRAIEEWPKNINLWEKCWKIYDDIEFYDGVTGQEAAFKFYNDNKITMEEGAELLWPERWGLFDLMMQYNADQISFMSEMQSEPKDSSDLSLDVDSFTYWSDRFTNIDGLLEHLGNEAYFSAACDPSMGSSTVKGDYSSIIILACKGKFSYIIVADIARRKPDKLIIDILSYCQRYQFRKFGIEANGFQELFVKQLREKAAEEKLSVEFVSIKNTKDKITRIQNIHPLITNGYLQFAKMHKLLLDECRQFPNCKYDDGQDALEMAVRLSSSVKKLDPAKYKGVFEALKPLRPSKNADDYFIVNGKLVKNIFKMISSKKVR